jgi:tRNA-dihydrouridine synthase
MNEPAVLAIAPMVKLGTYAFRRFVRDLTPELPLLAFSPMLDAHDVVDDPTYLDAHLYTCDRDAPLVVQLAGREPKVLRDAAHRILQQWPQIAGIDLNLGCPQLKARERMFGAFMAVGDEWDLVIACVLALRAGVADAVPISAKIRIDERPWATQQLVDALRLGGVSRIAVHGRTLAAGRNGAADWDAMATVVQWASPTPVLVNGSCCSPADIDALLAHTRAAGLMSAEPLLVDPYLFARWSNVRELPSTQWDTARRFVSFARRECGAATDLTLDAMQQHLLHILGLRERSKAVFRHMGIEAIGVESENERARWRQAILTTTEIEELDNLLQNVNVSLVCEED